jgi:exodeoxyribonuclease-3
MSFRIATWNVNSLRVRLPHVVDWLAANQPDVLCLQETKVPDNEFPVKEINELGYNVVFSGQKSYNGVATLTKTVMPTDAILDIPGLEDSQRRVMALTVDEVRVINLYIPNGQDITSEKYLYKLNWLKALNLFLADQVKNYKNVIVLGDFNIAPEDRDVYDPEAWQGQVLCTKPERDAFYAILSLGLKDCFRLQSQPSNSFSWWDYRLNAFKRNLGARIDHILATEPHASDCITCGIDKLTRGLDRPSDHAPVFAEFVT